MEYLTKDLAKEFNLPVVNVHSILRRLHIDTKIITINGNRKAVYNEDARSCLKNYLDIIKKYPLKITELETMQDKLIAEGFKPLYLYEEKINNNSLVTDKRFYKTDFFPSYEEITPFQFQEV